ncbi:MAG: ABC transporter ATP-binding protein [Actinomycetota bacterium]|nr:ABC transporter ATP-binding protein [Actinomycetota bacterium]
MTASLDAVVGVTRGDFRVDVPLSVPGGAVVALLGPNGAGKSTVLRALAGLLRLSRGHVRVDAETLEDAVTGVRVPAERRPTALVFQDYLLFPHLSARDNIAFGLRARGVGRRVARARADTLLAGIGLADRATARPSQLSGGQAQRVALARALAVEPRLLLLDEPLAALDAGTRMVVRSDLRLRLAAFGGATVLVTHDPLDALVMADNLVVIEAGTVVQAGSPAEVARRPLTDYVARLVGLNLLAGTASGTDVSLDGGGHLATASPHSGAVYVAVRPSAVALHLQEPHGSPRNVWRGVVSGLELQGDGVRVAVTGPPDVLVDVTAAAVAELGLRPGVPVWCAVKATELESYPR